MEFLKARIKFKRSKPRLRIVVIGKHSPWKQNHLIIGKKIHRKLSSKKINNLKSKNPKE